MKKMIKHYNIIKLTAFASHSLDNETDAVDPRRNARSREIIEDLDFSSDDRGWFI
ncbi:hypothetical protein [Flagellimonas lutimaris]|uniref:hypothetical protein n=1 Tax=Flagellimonas lutimaris TaxID=475082 RepID=UPI0039C10EE4|tara:strand:- start:3360 stop:3524 length:165 start_codon:yes stop_codon:yes gene_type:complete